MIDFEGHQQTDHRFRRKLDRMKFVIMNILVQIKRGRGHLPKKQNCPT
jgi:hypothetical protein